MIQKGVTLIELVVAISIMATLAVGINSLVATYSEDTKASVTATHLSTVTNAANSYIKNNFSSITAVATPTTPALIRVTDLVAGGYLTAGFSTKNPSQQDTCVLVLEPTPNNLTALAVTEGGVTIDDLGLGRIASTIGGAGGAIYSTANTTVRGAMGGYSFAVGNFANANHLGMKCDGVTAGVVSLSAGHPMVALWFDDSNPNASTLYRDAVPGNPSLNTMNTPIIMGAGSVQAVDAVCTTNGALGRDATGGVVSCVSGKWKAAGGSPYWQDPVLNFASLPVCNAAAMNQTRVVQTPSVGTGSRAYTCNGSGTWSPLGVNNDGNILVAGAATITKLDGNLEVTSVAVESTGCSPNGRIARDSSGLILSCQTGSWQRATKIAVQTCPSGQVVNGFNASGNPTCAAGGSTDFGEYKYASMSDGSIFCSGTGTYSNRCVQSNPKTGGCSCPAGSTPTNIAQSSAFCENPGYGRPYIYEITTTYACK